jgi:murein DD-endopeptidase MepM/ murein hydrolase activator NlpD
MLMGTLTAAQLRVHASTLQNSFDIVVPQPPSVVSVEGKGLLVYELHLTNFSSRGQTIQGVSALDRASNALLGRFVGADLRSRESLVAATPKPAAGDVMVAPGQRAVIFLELGVSSTDPPRSLRHEIEVSTEGKSDTYTLMTPEVIVGVAPRAALAPPLKGGPWVAVHSPTWERGHRRVFYSVGGRAHLPARFAVDWVRVDDAGRTTRGDGDRVADTLGYGEDVLAVADASVAAVRDNMSEPERISHAGKHEIADDAGNYVVLLLKDGRYAFYEHLKPGSIRVQAGQRVARGTVIGSLGFTGQSTGPHLHFHVADAPAPLDAEGLPFAMEGFRLLGRYQDMATLGRERWQPLEGSVAPQRSREWPDSNVVVQFPP